MLENSAVMKCLSTYCLINTHIYFKYLCCKPVCSSMTLDRLAHSEYNPRTRQLHYGRLPHSIHSAAILILLSNSVMTHLSTIKNISQITADTNLKTCQKHRHVAPYLAPASITIITTVLITSLFYRWHSLPPLLPHQKRWKVKLSHRPLLSSLLLILKLSPLL